MADQDLTPDEFTQLASADKIGLIDTLAGQMRTVGFDLAEAAFEFYGLEAVTPTKTDDKSNEAVAARERLAAARAKKARLDWRYDTLKHVVSALQSTLKAERVGVMDQT